jgi:hypothetical protein
VRLTTSPPSRAECREIWEPKPPGILWATPGLLRDTFTSTIIRKTTNFLITFTKTSNLPFTAYAILAIGKKKNEEKI